MVHKTSNKEMVSVSELMYINACVENVSALLPCSSCCEYPNKDMANKTCCGTADGGVIVYSAVC